jgi:hypothetical protein
MGSWRGLWKVIRNYLGSRPLPSLQPSFKYGAELIINHIEPSQYAYIKVPPELRQYVGVQRAMWRKGVIWTIPELTEDNESVGAIWAGGDTPEEAIEEVERISEEVELSSNLTTESPILHELLRTVEKGVKEGVPF